MPANHERKHFSQLWPRQLEHRLFGQLDCESAVNRKKVMKPAKNYGLMITDIPYGLTFIDIHGNNRFLNFSLILKGKLYEA